MHAERGIDVYYDAVILPIPPNSAPTETNLRGPLNFLAFYLKIVVSAGLGLCAVNGQRDLGRKMKTQAEY